MAALFTAATLAADAFMRYRLLPPRPDAAPVAGALRADAPAVVNMLANDATVTAAGLRATVIDLAARGWLRILPPDDQHDELCRVRPAATAFEGDALRPHERLVLQHIMARFTDDRAIPARFLAVDVRGAWWRRFASLVVDDARQSGLVKRRWEPLDLAVPGGLAVIAILCTFAAWVAGDDHIAVIDSINRRTVWVVLIAVLVAVVVRLVRTEVRPEYTLTDTGVTATKRWLAVRRRLDQSGFAEMAPSAVALGDRRLAYATAMCLAEGAAVELPLAREDHRRAWSSVGGRARLVRVHYPMRPGYGMQPFVALGVGVVMCFVGLWVRRWSSDVARGEAFDWIYERLPEQGWLIADIATAITFLTAIPIVLGLWLALAGAADGFTTVERTGRVIRSRRPAEVSPLPRRVRRMLERDRYSAYVAVDDGTSATVFAWRTNERQAVPQGARATVRATYVLGHVRRAVPVGHRLVE
jgi:hypothetical protein